MCHFNKYSRINVCINTKLFLFTSNDLGTEMLINIISKVYREKYTSCRKKSLLEKPFIDFLLSWSLICLVILRFYQIFVSVFVNQKIIKKRLLILNDGCLFGFVIKANFNFTTVVGDYINKMKTTFDLNFDLYQAFK